MHRRTWWKAGQWVVGIAIVIIAANRLAHNWAELRQQPLDWQIRPVYLVAAVLLTFAMYAILIQAWRTVLASWGARLDALMAARIWTTSSLGKYLPGKVWAIAGMAVMAQRAGVPPWVATGAAVLLQALAIAAGGGVVAMTGFAALETAYPWLRPALLAVMVGAALGIGLLLWRPFVVRLFGLVGVAPDRVRTPTPTALFLALAANTAAWIGYGAAFLLLARGLLPNIRLGLPLAVGAFTASYLAGFLALIAPGGLLVREGTLFLMLQGVVGPAAAGALAIASRIMLTITEFGAAVPFVIRSSSSSSSPGEPTRVLNSRRGTNSTR